MGAKLGLRSLTFFVIVLIPISFCAQGLGDLNIPIEGSGTSSALHDPIRPSTVALNGGRITLGVIYGDTPYDHNSSQFNLIGSGLLELTALGVPISLEMGNGSNTPMRGRRTVTKFSLDTDRLNELRQLEYQDALQKVRNEKEILIEQIHQLERLKVGLQRRARLSDGIYPDPPAMDVKIDTLLTDTSLPDSSLPDSSMIDTPGQITEEDDVRRTLTTEPSYSDKLQRIEHQITTHENALDELEAQEEKLSLGSQSLLPNILKETSGFTFRKFEFGDCMPIESHYLINGVGFNGVSTTVQAKGYEIGISHGKSYDDLWRSELLTEDRSREAQRMFLFEEPSGSDPRRLSAFTIGRTDNEGMYIRGGVLLARRSQTMPGSLLKEDVNTGEHRNIVLEISGGIRLNKANQLDVTVARSLDRYIGAEDIEEQTNEPSALSEGTDLSDHAGSISWTLAPGRSRTQLKVEGRLVGQEFQSLGVNFLRVGSKRVSAELDQGVGRKLRFKIGILEEKRVPVEDGGSMKLQRLRFAVNYRISQKVTLRATHTPQRTIMDRGTPVIGSHRMSGLGCRMLQNIGKLRLVLNTDIDHYRMAHLEINEMFFFRSGVGLSVADDLSCGLSVNAWNVIDDQGIDISLNGRSKITKTLETEWQWTLPADAERRSSWNIAVQKVLSSKLSASLSASKVSTGDIVFNDLLYISDRENYYCSATMTFNW